MNCGTFIKKQIYDDNQRYIATLINNLNLWIILQQKKI